MRIAYLVNRYPAVSHSFIRREIEAIEALGTPVDRYSIRYADGDLPDPADQREREQTFFVLRQGAAKLILATACTAVRRPGRFLNALSATLRMSNGSPLSLMRHIAYLVEACLIAGRLRGRPVDHVHCHFGTNPATVALLLHRLTGVPFSTTVHGPTEFDQPAAYRLRDKVAEAAFSVGISSYGRSQLMRWSDPKHWPKLAIVRCGLDATFLDELPADQGEPGNELVFVGRLAPQKGVPLLLDAAARLKDRGRDFKLTLVGDGDLRGQIEAIIETRGLERHVAIAGWRSAAQVRDHLLGARAFVLPSFAEGLPVVLMEALALRRPVITTAIAGTPELVDGGCGWLIPAGSVDALVDAMASALDADTTVLRAMGETGRTRVLAAHDARKNGALMLDLINGVRTGL